MHQVTPSSLRDGDIVRVDRGESEDFRTKRGRKSFFTPEGKVTLAFMKMYTGLSAPKLTEALNGDKGSVPESGIICDEIIKLTGVSHPNVIPKFSEWSYMKTSPPVRSLPTIWDTKP